MCPFSSARDERTATATSGRLTRWTVLAAVVVFVALRLPALVQPPGGDQGLYAYVGQRILSGELPYRDAWDQKPPAIHVAYAAMLAIWPDLHVVAVADLVLALLTALALWRLGTRLRSPAAGASASLLYLGLANPVFQRLGGVRIRAQCESFIALLATVAVALAWSAGRRSDRRVPWLALLSGFAVGLAITFKYNAAAYALPAAAALWLASGRSAPPWRAFALLAAGAAVPVGFVLAVYASAGSLADLRDATYTYNLFYSGETYRGAWHFLAYLVSFPIQHARVDSLWWMGGLGCVVIAAAAWRDPRGLVAVLWVAAACLTIAVNGSRGLPQYFVQAWPALALAAGIGLAACWPRMGPVLRVALVALLATGIWRVTDIPKGLDYTAHDLRYASGRLSREAYLGRFGSRASGDKYSALAIEELAAYLRRTTSGADRVLVFGFSPAALVEARRVSASRFFWSRPVIVGFNTGRPGYGVDGLLAELAHTSPKVVVLQRRDWDPDGPDSWTFFLGDRRLAGWLHDAYDPAGDLGNYALWVRRTPYRRRP